MHGDDDQTSLADRTADRESLQDRTLKAYKGFPAEPPAEADTINADLLAFVQS